MGVLALHPAIVDVLDLTGGFQPPPI
jgi:hypothetical protein